MITRKNRREKLLRLQKSIMLLVIFLFILALAYGIFSYVNLSSNFDDNVVSDPDIESLLKQEDLVIIQNEKLDNSVNRPLFLPSRRPFEEIEETEEKDAEVIVSKKEPLNETLSSIIIIEDKKTAFLENEDGSIRVEEGMIYKGWSIESISKDSILVKNGGEEKTLSLRKFSISQPKEVIELGN